MNSEAIAQKLVDLRGNRTQKSVADALGISESALVKYERGERIPRDDVKIRIANYYKKSVNYIFFG